MQGTNETKVDGKETKKKEEEKSRVQKESDAEGYKASKRVEAYYLNRL